MRKLLLATLLIWTLSAQAALKPLLVMHLYDNLRIVLSQETECEGKKGVYKASAQRLDKKYIPGCWYVMKEYPNMIHIDWHNGDYSELPLDKFEAFDVNQ